MRSACRRCGDPSQHRSILDHGALGNNPADARSGEICSKRTAAQMAKLDPQGSLPISPDNALLPLVGTGQASQNGYRTPNAPLDDS